MIRSSRFLLRHNNDHNNNNNNSFLSVLRNLMQWNKTNAAATHASALSLRLQLYWQTLAQTYRTLQAEQQKQQQQQNNNNHNVVSSLISPTSSSAAAAATTTTPALDVLATVVHQRYSCRRFDPTQKVPRALLEHVLRLTTRSPTGYNLQGYHMVVLESEADKQAACIACLGQRQILEASHLIIFVADKECERNAPAAFELGLEKKYYRSSLYGAAYLRQVYYYLHGGPANAMACVKRTVSEAYTSAVNQHSTTAKAALITVPESPTAYGWKQSMLACGLFLHLCTAANLQTSALEGFDENALKKLIGLEKKSALVAQQGLGGAAWRNPNHNNQYLFVRDADRYTIPVMVCVGYAAESEKMPNRVYSPRFAPSHFIRWNRF